MPKSIRICPVCQKEFMQDYNKSICCSHKCAGKLLTEKAASRIATRFWSKVKIGKDNECWEWQGYVGHNGYGKFRVGKKMYLAHRIAYCLHKNGSIELLNDNHILHTCDNRKCCNWHHHFEGTRSDNMVDMYSKGRHSKIIYHKTPDGNGKKLTWTEVRQIREIYKSKNITKTQLANQFNISVGMVGRIIENRAWKEAS